MKRRALSETAAWLHQTRFWLCWYTDADYDETTAFSETMRYFQKITSK